MPIYEYKCFKCEYQVELLQKMNDNHKVQCPQCTSYINKIISLSNFKLKGNGWYKTDYKKKKIEK